MRSKRRKWALNLIGIAAVLALGVIILLSFQIPHTSQNQVSVSQLSSATLEFDSEELVYSNGYDAVMKISARFDFWADYFFF